MSDQQHKPFWQETPSEESDTAETLRLKPVMAVDLVDGLEKKLAALVDVAAEQLSPPKPVDKPTVDTTVPQPDSVEVTLGTPITHAKRDITKVTVRRPTGLDLRMMSRQPNDQTPWLMSQLTDLSFGAFDKMDGADWAAIAEVVAHYLKKYR